MKFKTIFLFAIFLSVNISGKTVVGIVVDNAINKPIEKAVVMLLHQNKIYSMIATDSTGLFSFDNIDLDRFYIKAKRIGYAEALTGPLRIPKSDTLKLIIKLEAQDITLNEQVVEEKRINEWLKQDGFYERKELGFGHFLKVDDIKDRSFNKASQILESLPEIVIVPTTNNISKGEFGPKIYSRRSMFMGPQYQVTVYVDGISLDDTGMIDNLNPYDIAAVEFYPTTATAPAKFSLKAGGVLLIWTKR